MRNEGEGEEECVGGSGVFGRVDPADLFTPHREHRPSLFRIPHTPQTQFPSSIPVVKGSIPALEGPGVEEEEEERTRMILGEDLK